MKSGRYFWKLFLGNALLMGLVLGVSVWLILRAFDRVHARDLTDHLRTLATTQVPVVSDRFDLAHGAELDRLIKDMAEAADHQVRITMVALDGTVLGDSEAHPQQMENHADRPEIRQALAQGWGASTRWSDTVKRELTYVAIRVGPAEAPLGVVRAAMTVGTIVARTRSAHELLWATALVGLVSAVALALGLARLWSERIRQITATAQELTRGDLTARVRVKGSDEVGALGQALNDMRDRLVRQLDARDRQRRILESLLGQLQEGVVAVRPDGRIVLINPTARHLLGIADPAGRRDDAAGDLRIDQCLDQPTLLQMCLPSGQASAGAPSNEAPLADRSGLQIGAAIQEARLELGNDANKVAVLARATDITLPESADDTADGTAPAARETGRLLVLTDITELTRTIQMKTDFVANASHELRTPLAAIRAAVETLKNMNLDEDASPTGRFLDVIDRHGTRLEQMVSDALDLSRIESASTRFEPTELSARQVCDDLQERWADALQEKQLNWDCRIAPQCDQIVANDHLLRLVLDNLVDNAIKFTSPGGRVDVSCRRSDQSVTMSVSDDGCGIPPEQHQRVFERFYQVSWSRSARRGDSAPPRGSGLGLSIVRHAVAAMKGMVELQSTPGRGTRVTVTIPDPKPPGGRL